MLAGVRKVLTSHSGAEALAYLQERCARIKWAPDGPPPDWDALHALPKNLATAEARIAALHYFIGHEADDTMYWHQHQLSTTRQCFCGCGPACAHPLGFAFTTVAHAHLAPCQWLQFLSHALRRRMLTEFVVQTEQLRFAPLPRNYEGAAPTLPECALWMWRQHC